MTSKEYLRQACWLDQKINSDIAEVAHLRQMASSISAPALGDRVQSSRSGDAPFVRSMEKILLMEEEINREIDRLIDLKEQIRSVIAAVPDSNERLVLRLRYIQGLTWEQIGLEMNANERTIRRWHGKALLHIAIPKNPIII